MTEPLLPPAEFADRPFHQLQGEMNGVIERMGWENGKWVRSGCHLSPEEMAAQWRYLRPFDETTPKVSWPVIPAAIKEPVRPKVGEVYAPTVLQDQHRDRRPNSRSKSITRRITVASRHFHSIIPVR